MAEVINLRMARKARQRDQARQQAGENRAKFGQGKPERAKARLDAERAGRLFEGHQREEQ